MFTLRQVTRMAPHYALRCAQPLPDDLLIVGTTGHGRTSWATRSRSATEARPMFVTVGSLSQVRHAACRLRQPREHDLTLSIRVN
jgi:hypothetical protein